MTDNTPKLTPAQKVVIGKALSNGWRVKNAVDDIGVANFILFKPDGHPYDIAQYAQNLTYFEAWLTMPPPEFRLDVTPTMWPISSYIVTLSRRGEHEPADRVQLSPTVTRVLDTDGNEIAFTFAVDEVLVREYKNVPGTVSRRLTVTLASAQDKPFTIYGVEGYA